MVWKPAVSPAASAHHAEVVTVADALVTRFDRGRLHTLDAPGAPRLWMTGAVHDEAGALVDASRRWWSGDPSAPVSVDPGHAVAARQTARQTARLDGTWRYAGHWSEHFGHFFLEVLTNLWGPVAPVDGLVLHRTYRGRAPGPRRDGLRSVDPDDLATWQRDLLGLAGYADTAIRVVRHRPVRVERLVVASRPVLLKSWAAPEAVEVWRRMSDAVGERGGAERVFLSRSRFNRDGVTSRREQADHAWDERLDAVMAAAGFVVVHPELLSIAAQLAAVRGARVLAGPAGSALHLSAFARPGTHVLEIGDVRSPAEAMPTQRMVDAACGHLTAFVPHRDERRLAQVLESLPG